MSDAVTLPLRAENNPKFYSRFIWLGLGALAFMLYCLYDGFINYPDQMVRGEAVMATAEATLSQEELNEIAADGGGHGRAGVYDHLVEEMPDHPEFQSAWESKAEENGWSTEPPAKLRSPGSIVNQHIMAVLSLIAALWFLSTVFLTRGRWIELNEQGITSSWGQAFALDQVTTIDKKKWRDKGIAYIRYRDEKGKQRSFVVDDYKYHRKTTDRILWYIENMVGFDKITGGKPGPDPDAQPVDPSAAATPPPQTNE